MTRIQSTTDYDKFNFIVSNREQYRKHIERIKQGFEEYGNLTKVQPILVNEKFDIIDGQHRFIACKELGEPIYYTMTPGLGVAEARSMNILHKSWLPLDYARSYALQGDTNYQKFIQLMEDYGFSFTTTLKYAEGSEIKGMNSRFRKGEFVLTDEKGARERLDKLAGAGLFVPFVTNEKFGSAFLRAINVENYDHKRMLKKLELHQHLLEPKGSVQDSLRMLEEIYNYQMSETNRLRFY